MLKNLMRPEAKFAVHKCARLSDDHKLPHDQAAKCVLNYLKGTATQGLIPKPDPEKEIDCYLGTNFAGRWIQEKGEYPGSVLYGTGYVITYENCTII